MGRQWGDDDVSDVSVCRDMVLPLKLIFDKENSVVRNAFLQGVPYFETHPNIIKYQTSPHKSKEIIALSTLILCIRDD